jgi:mono/diheme cytochrome c family protein
MRRMWKIALGVVLTPVVALSGLGATAQLRWDRTFDAPEPALRASLDADVIERGRYLAFGPAHCAVCHSTQDKWARIEAGEELPLTGGFGFKVPFGTIYTANLTPDGETGIGRWTDAQLARMLRHGIRPDGRAAAPFMEFQNLSDEDIVALISYLRAQPPVRNEVPQHEYNMLGKALMAFMITPRGPESVPPARAPAELPTVERGEYMANNVAGCVNCHSKRDMMDGSYIGPRFAGGHEMPFDDDPTKMFVSPNLTPDPATGHIHQWSEEQFVARFRAGRVHPQSHMPWGLFVKMSDADLQAIYRYLRTLEPVRNETGPIVQDVKAKG